MSDDRFDALETARDLEATGIGRPHAEAIARAVGRAVAPLATKTDVQRLETTLRGDFERSQVAMRGDIELHDASTKADFVHFESSMTSDFERFQTTIGAEFANFRADMYRALWIQGAGIVAVVAALELLL